MKIKNKIWILLTTVMFFCLITTNMNVKADKVTEDYNKTFNLIGHAKVVNKSVELTKGTIQSQVGGISGKEKIDLKKDFYAEIMTELGGSSYQADGIAAFFQISGENKIGYNGSGLGMAGLDGFGVSLTDDRNSSKISRGYFTTSSEGSKFLTKFGREGYFDQNKGKNFLRIKWDAQNKELIYYVGSSTTVSIDKFHMKQSDFGKSNAFWEKAYNEGVTFDVTASTGSSAGSHNVTLNYYQPNIEKPKINLPEELLVSNINEFNPLEYVKNTQLITDNNLGDLTTVNGYNAYTPEYIEANEFKIDNYKKRVDYYAYNAATGSPAKHKMFVKQVKETWPNGDTNGWLDFAGNEVNLLNDPETALIGNYAYYSKEHAAIYKIFNGEDRFKVGKKYKVTVYAKPEKGSTEDRNIKVSLKKDPGSTEYRELLNTNLFSGEKVQKDYYGVTAEFEINKDEEEPLITVENFKGGYIGAVDIQEIAEE